MDDLNMFTEKQPLIEVTAKSLAMPRVPQVLFVHSGITVRHQQAGIKSFIHPERRRFPCEHAQQHEQKFLAGESLFLIDVDSGRADVARSHKHAE